MINCFSIRSIEYFVCMDILIAPDKFKGSLNALEVCKALEKGVKINHNINNIFLCPLADGGDGSLNILNY